MASCCSPRRLTLCAVLVGYASGMVNTVNRAGFLEVEPPDAFESLQRRRLDDTPNPYTCKDGVKSAKEDWKVFGTNLGGWLVLEPWITPSLFYQFLSLETKYGTDTPQHTAMDQFTFCKALGPAEGNKQLRRHWRAWVREEDIRAIADSGANVVRVPVGDWMYVPYGKPLAHPRLCPAPATPRAAALWPQPLHPSRPRLYARNLFLPRATPYARPMPPSPVAHPMPASWPPARHTPYACQ
jgi:hypothetical protein